MMWRFDENVATIVEAESFAGFQFGQEVRGHVNVAATNEPAFNSGRVEIGLKSINSKPNVRARVIVDARKYMWSAGDHADAVGNG